MKENFFFRKIFTNFAIEKTAIGKTAISKSIENFFTTKFQKWYIA